MVQGSATDFAVASRPRDRITAELTYELVQSLGAGHSMTSSKKLIWWIVSEKAYLVFLKELIEAGKL